MIVLLIIVFTISLYSVSYCKEKKEYNDGICPLCGYKLKYGGRFHKRGIRFFCSNCGMYEIFLKLFDPYRNLK